MNVRMTNLLLGHKMSSANQEKQLINILLGKNSVSPKRGYSDTHQQ